MATDCLKIRDGENVVLAVPPRLDSITTYVLLEQESWFEKELEFLRRWLKPGMTAIDIGANLGVYSMPMARLVGTGGKVFAYEPGSEARTLQEHSRDLNGAAHVEILASALSNSDCDGHLVFGHSSEMNALGDSGEGEAVHITSLDIEDTRRGWGSPDFVKIDAEGQEERIFDGGHDFFARHSPLVMFEIKANASVNPKLLAAFPLNGYRLYRLLVGAPVLVPLDPQAPLDPYEVNLFAAKPDRAASLCGENLLVESIPAWEPKDSDLADGLSLMQSQAFAPGFGRLIDNISQLDPDYAKSLAAYAVWRAGTTSLATRYASLILGCRILTALCSRAPTAARCATLARLTREAGWRSQSVMALGQVLARLRRSPFQTIEPCWPPSPRFDQIGVAENPVLWLTAAAAEEMERSQSFSTFFTGRSPFIDWLCAQPIALAEMHRRATLVAARGGARPVVPRRLCEDAPDHRNADIWRSGQVPGTRVHS